MNKERLFKLCDNDTLEGAIGMIMSEHIDIGGDMVGVSVDNFEKVGKMLIEYAEKRKTPKRKPDANGVLQLTKEELREFGELVDEENIEKVMILRGGIEFRIKNEPCKLAVYEVKAILWLAERFNLEV